LAAAGLFEEDDRRHVERSHSWMDPSVLTEVDEIEGFFCPRCHGRRELAFLTGERQHRAVVVGVEVNVEQAGVECTRESMDRARVASGGDVGDSEERHPDRRCASGSARDGRV
jgi:hypothetical protein